MTEFRNRYNALPSNLRFSEVVQQGLREEKKTSGRSSSPITISGDQEAIVNHLRFSSSLEQGRRSTPLSSRGHSQQSLNQDTVSAAEEEGDRKQKTPSNRS